MQPADIAAANRNRQPTPELHAAITALYEAIRSEPEPDDKAQLSSALRTLLAVQAKNAKQEAGARK